MSFYANICVFYFIVVLSRPHLQRNMPDVVYHIQQRFSELKISMKSKILVLIFLTNIQNVYCCKCAQSSFIEQIGYSDLIFKGTPISLEISNTSKIYKFVSKKVWKGESKDTFSISTGLDQGSCEFSFQVGKEYVIYSSKLITGFCSRTKQSALKTEEIKLDDFFSKKQELFINDSTTITKTESSFIQEFLKNKKDLNGKRVLFANNHFLYNKKDWYKLNEKYDEIVMELVELTQKEKKTYSIDFIVNSWSKIKVNEKIKQKILSQIK